MLHSDELIEEVFVWSDWRLENFQLGASMMIREEIRERREFLQFKGVFLLGSDQLHL